MVGRQREAPPRARSSGGSSVHRSLRGRHNRWFKKRMLLRSPSDQSKLEVLAARPDLQHIASQLRFWTRQMFTVTLPSAGPFQMSACVKSPCPCTYLTKSILPKGQVYTSYFKASYGHIWYGVAQLLLVSCLVDNQTLSHSADVHCWSVPKQRQQMDSNLCNTELELVCSCCTQGFHRHDKHIHR